MLKKRGGPPINKDLVPNREIARFIEFAGGPAKAARIFDCTPDMVQKMRRGERQIAPRYVRALYHHKGFQLSFKRLFDLDQRSTERW